MTRWLWILGLAAALGAPAQERPKPAKPPVEEVEPPEEDAGLTPKVYEFNPLQAQKELSAGNFYMKKGSFKAAANRFREATRWDPTSALAFLKLGEAEEKRNEKEAAREAYKKYLELAPDAKNAAAIRKKLGAS